MKRKRLVVIWSIVVLSGLVLLGCGNKVERSIKKLESTKKEERDAAFMELMLAKGSAIPPLIEALGDKERSAKVRADIAEALFRMYVREGDPQIVPAFLAHINDPSPEVRGKIAAVLADADAKEAISPLLERLSKESESNVREEVLTALEILDGWEIERGFAATAGVLTVKGGENMTEAQRATFIEILKDLYKEADRKELRERAEEFLEKIAQQRVQEADKYVLKGDITRAEEQYLEAKALVPNSVNVNNRLGKFYFENGWPDKGLGMLKDLGLVVYARRLRKVPTIDGNLSDDAWKDAAKISRFYQNIHIMRAIPAEGESEVYVGYADENLYIGVKGYEESTKDLTAQRTKRDEPVWMDDCAEMFFDTDHDYSTYYQIIVNSIGTIADLSKTRDQASGGEEWNGTYNVATQVEEDFWTLEIEIPFKEIGATRVKKGTIWGFNVARVRIAHKGEYDQWVPTYGSSLRPDLFGFLIFE